MYWITKRRGDGLHRLLLTVILSAAMVLSSFLLQSRCAYAGVQPEENKDVTEVGDVFQWLLPALAFGSTFVAGSAEGKWWDKEGTWQFTKSAGSTIVTTQVLKSLTGKWRPRSYTGAGAPSDISFPSGHTSAAFAGAAFINTRYGPWWGVPAYAAAVFTAYSRVQADAHYLDDVTAGASIALLYNFLWVTPQSWSEKYALMPIVAEEGAGFQVMVKIDDGAKPDTDTKKQKEKDHRFRFNFGFGPAFTTKNKITSPTDTGTTFDLSEPEDAEDTLTTAAVEFDILLGKRHEVSLFWLPFENRDIGSFSTPIAFAGQVYPANTDIISAWRQNEIKGVYRYNLTPESNWQWKAGIGVFAQNTNIALATEDYSIESEVDDWVILPVLHGSLDYKIAPKWTLSLYADGIYFSQDTYLDATAAINYQFSRHWDASLGYEYYNRNIETSDLTNQVVLQIPFIAVAYSW